MYGVVTPGATPDTRVRAVFLLLVWKVRLSCDELISLAGEGVVVVVVAVKYDSVHFFILLFLSAASMIAKGYSKVQTI
jgi:hypothetical protein